MDKSDFDYNQQNFEREIIRASKGFSVARDHFLQNVNHWKELASDDILLDPASFDIINDKRTVVGNFIGRRFTIHIVPRLTLRENYAEVIVFIDHLTSDEKTEVSRFLVSPSGSIHDVNEEPLLNWDDSYFSYRLVIAIAHRVLGREAAA